jgi:enamine deaminase RidA (YjgF/YER057c/UK114 family)
VIQRIRDPAERKSGACVPRSAGARPLDGKRAIGIASGSRLVFLAGQVAQDGDGQLVGPGDLAAQVEQAMLNVAAGLEAAGATFDDVAKTTLYVVDWDQSKMEPLVTGFGRAAEQLGSISVSPVTLVPVPRLFEEGHLIEIEVTAVLA